MLLLPSSGCSSARTPLGLLHLEEGHMSSGLIKGTITAFSGLLRKTTNRLSRDNRCPSGDSIRHLFLSECIPLGAVQSCSHVHKSLSLQPDETNCTFGTELGLLCMVVYTGNLCYLI